MKDDMAERRFFICGDVDLANAARLQAEMVAVFADNDDDFTVDCSGLTFMDSSGIAALSAAARTLQSEGRAFRIVNADQFADRLFELIGSSDALHVNMQGVTPIGCDGVLMLCAAREGRCELRQRCAVYELRWADHDAYIEAHDARVMPEHQRPREAR